MANIAGTCFAAVSVGGTGYQGVTCRSGGADYLRYHIFPAAYGHGSPIAVPEKITSHPELSIGGYLSAGLPAALAGMCGCGGGADFSALRTPSKTAIAYGDIAKSYSTTECVGSRLTITGRPNELVEFSLEAFGMTTTTGAGVAAATGDKEFFPFERGSNSGIGADTLLGFTLSFTTGFVPVYAMDGLAETGYAEIGDVGASCTLELALAHTNEGEYGAYTGATETTIALTLTSPGGSSSTISVTGYYTGFDYGGDVGGILVSRATLYGVGATMLSIA